MHKNKPMKRREFIRNTAFAAAATAVAPSFAFAEKRKIGLQLYSLRDVINKDVTGILKKVAEFGYKELETYGYNDGNLFGMKAKEFGDTVKGLGMKVTSGHYGTGQTNPAVKGTLSNDWERAVIDAKETGQEFMVVAYLVPEERKSLDDYKKVCELINKCGEIARKNGIRLGYHNHNFEFEKIAGQVPYELMLKELDPKLVSMEMDIYWVVNAGFDPLQLISKYPGRFEQWHVKDMDKADRKLNADVGTGSIDFKTIFTKASESGMKHFYIEQETYPKSSLESIESSIKNLSMIV